MKKINILESLLELDKKSSNRYELATLYEACKLEDDDKVQLVKYIDSYEHPSLIGQFLESKCEGMCDTNVDDDDCTDIECLKKTVDDINDNEVPVVFAFDDFEEIEEKESLNEEIVIDDSRAAQKYVWNKVKDIDSITDDDSMYWQFDDGIRQGDSAKIITDEIDLPDSAFYKFSFVELDMNIYFDYDNDCWYVLDKTYEAPVVEEAVEIHECPVCGRNFAEHEVSGGSCPKCGEEVHKTDSGEYEKTDNDIDESKCIKESTDDLKGYNIIKKDNIFRVTDDNDVELDIDFESEDDAREYINTISDDDINESKSIKEDYKGRDDLGEILGWLQNRNEVWDDFCVDFEDVNDSDLTYDKVLNWIKLHNELYSDFTKSFENDLDEDLQKDLERRYTISDAHTNNSVLRNIEELAASELIKEIKPIIKHDTQMFEMTSSDGRTFYLIPVTMSQFDVYSADENLITRSEFAKYIVDEVLSDKSNLEFVYEIVDGDCEGKYSREELEALPCFSGKYTDDQSEIRANGGFTSREELDNQPVLNGYVGPMMDGWENHKMRIRYETQEIYDRLSEDTDDYVPNEDDMGTWFDDIQPELEEAFGVELEWNDYCPHCTNRTLVMVNDDVAVCDECAAEYRVIPMANGKVRLIDIDDLEEGLWDDVKKVGKTVKDIAKDRWNDSYTKAIATGVKKNLAKTKLGQDLKRVGDSIKDTDTYKKVAGKINDAKQAIEDNKHDDNRKPQNISMNVRGKDYRVSDLKFKLNGKQISSDDVAKMSAFERRKVQVIVPRGIKPVTEGWFSDDDFEDDIAHANLYGGDTTYCRDCGTKKVYDEDGFAYCPKCNDEVEL